MNTQYQPARGSSTTPSTGENTFMLPQPGTMGAGRAFSLSRVEVESYFATNAARAATGTSANWWLRSMNPNTTLGLLVGNAGNITPSHLDGPLGVRPAVWVSVN